MEESTITDSSHILAEERNEKNSTSEDINKSSGQKKRTISKSSIGNQHLFNQQVPKKPKSTLARISSEIAARESFRDLKILNEIEDLYRCCPVGGEHGCCLKHFVVADEKGGCTINYENAVQYVKNCRLVSKEGNSNDIRDPLIINIFKSCIRDDTIRGDERIFKMEYQIPSPQNLLGRDNVVKCCKKAVQVIYGISDHEWKLTSSLLKETINGNLQTLHHKPYTDAHLHLEYTHAIVKGIFKENLRTEFPGNINSSSILTLMASS
jgi:hypothetical protein